MTRSLRSRFMWWMLLLLVSFFVVQTAVFLVYEVHEWRTMSTPHWDEEQGELMVLLGVDVVILPAMVFLMWWVSARMLRPVRAIARTSQRISSGALDERIEVDTPDDEIGMLAESINRAFDRYREAVDRLNRFSADASHQLRTPLTAIRSTGEVCLQQPRDQADYREAIQSMLEDVQRLSYMVEQLLSLARLDAERVREGFVRIDLAAEAAEAAEPFRPLWEDKGIELRLALEPGLLLRGDAALVQQVVANLLDNALRHTPGGGWVEVAARREPGGELSLTVADSGQGIPPDYRDLVFDRFSTVPNGPGGGAGLGLAIVRDIVCVHGGSVEVVSAPGQGARFKTRWPVA